MDPQSARPGRPRRPVTVQAGSGHSTPAGACVECTCRCETCVLLHMFKRVQMAHLPMELSGNDTRMCLLAFAQAAGAPGETTDSEAAADEGGDMSLVVVVILLVLCCCAGGVLLKAKSSDKGEDKQPEDSSQSTPGTGTGRAPPPKPPSRPPNRAVSLPFPRLLHLVDTPAVTYAVCTPF